MPREHYDVAGKVVLVTGAARGLGLEAARRLHALGASVALVGLEPDELERRATELGERAWWYEADVTDTDAVEAAVAGAVERFGGLDVVIANAGIAANGTVASIDPAAFERTIEVNLLGVWRTVRAALPHVVARRGYVLIVSSASALVHTPMMAAYTASKAGVEAFGDALRMEVAHTGTKVGVAYFSFIDTDMVRRGFDRPSAQYGRERLGGPFSRWAPVSDVGDAIVAGVTRRARHVMVPGSLKPLLYLRSVVQPLMEWQSRRRGVDEVIKMAEREATELTTPQPSTDGRPAAAAPPPR
ncbi:MAG TPA: SDR family oxidoreductase [Solirubrobacteraceae bacterium]|jgi:NAD(P)-dependent dehydrogenase (short-subunit alcohol dehydrogenase family)